MKQYGRNSFYCQAELKKIGLKSYGKNVLISRKASIYSPEDIVIGNDVRIDDFCILSGKIELGNNIHISAYAALFAGDAGIYCEDYVCISGRTMVYAISDDYSGEYMTNPTIPDKYKKVQSERVLFKKHSLVGAGCIVLPGVVLGEGSSVGAMSLINKDIEAWSMNVGIPTRKIKERSKRILELEKQYKQEKFNRT